MRKLEKLKEVRGVKALCFCGLNIPFKAIGYNF